MNNSLPESESTSSTKIVDNSISIQNIQRLWQLNETPYASQSLVFYRKSRKFYILTETKQGPINLFNHIQSSLLSELSNNVTFISKNCQITIMNSENPQRAFFNECPVSTLADYVQFRREEKKLSLQDEELCSILQMIVSIVEPIIAILPKVSIMPSDLILTEEGNFKLIDASLYCSEFRNDNTRLQIDTLDVVCNFLMRLTHTGNTSPQSSEEYLSLIEASYPLLFSRLAKLKNINEFEGNIEPFRTNQFSSSFLNKQKEFLFWKYAKIVDYVSLEATMKDHFAISDHLTLDSSLLQEFWEYYLSSAQGPRQEGTRRYKLARWKGLVFNEKVPKSDYQKALVSLEEHYQDKPSLEAAAVYDGLACVAFAEGTYEISRDFFEKGLDMIININGKGSSIEAAIHSNLTHVQARLGYKEQAKESTSLAVDITLKHYSENDMFFTILHGNKIILTSSDEEKAQWLKKSIELKKLYWNQDHPNVYLSVNNFFCLAKRAYGNEFPFVDQTAFDIERLDSHMNYFGPFHHTGVEIARSICYKLYFIRKDYELLRFLGQMTRKYKFAKVFPLEEEFKGKVLKRSNNPLGLDLTKAAYSKELRIQKNNNIALQNWVFGIDFPYWSSQKELEKNIIYSFEFQY